MVQLLTLKPKVKFKVPVEAECISPDVFKDESLDGIRGLPVLWGNRQKTLGEVFDVKAEGSDGSQIRIEGDAGWVKHIGAEMTAGSITIQGDAGMHLGRGMEGGEIKVEGNAREWLGAEMEGGYIDVTGSVGDLAGSAYRGSGSGMSGGTIIVRGNAGGEVGELISGGTIAVEGLMGSFTGALMSGGLIVCMGGLGERPGAGMTNGTIMTMAKPRLLPTFKYTRIYNPKLLAPKLEELAARGFPIGKDQIAGMYGRYEGDLAAGGKGRIIVWQSGPGAAPAGGDT